MRLKDKVIIITGATSGIGSAIMDSWVGIIGGKKIIETVPGHGYRLQVSFPRN